MTTPRVHVDAKLARGASVALPDDQRHYLMTVLRLADGADVRAFNARDGEFACVLRTPTKKTAALEVGARARAPKSGLDLDLLFAPLKKTRTDFVVEKATELGVARLRPVLTARTGADRVNVARLSATAREAAEQCERLDVPAVAEPEKLAQVLVDWAKNDPGRRLWFADEGAAGAPTPWRDPNAPAPAAFHAFMGAPDGDPPGPQAVLIGPEGGFTPEERAAVRALPHARPFHLGPRILRADTAAVAALTLWQAILGDATRAHAGG